MTSCCFNVFTEILCNFSYSYACRGVELTNGGVVEECIFCQIAQGRAPCHKIWEDSEHLAFLSIFPNTEGFSVVIPKAHYTSYAFEQSDEVLTKLILATKKVATILDESFDDVGRTGMFFEGYGVNHLHSKLFPMHGTGPGTDFKLVESASDYFFERYEGYLSSHDSKRADDLQLAQLATRIRQVASRR